MNKWVEEVTGTLVVHAAYGAHQEEMFTITAQ
jgi:hypothetical protein